jgi:hypothetical protein
MTAAASPPQGGESPARLQRRAHIIKAARALVGAEVLGDFDLVRADLCPIDLVMVAGAPWLKDGLERDFAKDEAGYRKLGGSANTPAMPYFFRNATNLVHYLKRQGFYVPRGGEKSPMPGMACFFDWDDRGRFNFTPDRSGVVLEVEEGNITRVALAQLKAPGKKRSGFVVRALPIETGDPVDRAIIGHADLP